MENLFGRAKIVTDVDIIDRTNIEDVVKKVEQQFVTTIQEIDYLYDYYVGKQDILNRTKDIRSDICNMIVENRAKEIVDFKTGYLCNNPIQFISRGNDASEGETASQSVAKLNDFMLSEGKASKDKALIDWMNIAGIGFRMVFPDELADPDVETDEAPFELYTLDPRNAGIIRSNGITNKPLAGFYRVVRKIDDEQKTIYTVYTPDSVYTLYGSELQSVEANGLGMIPIIEYQANIARMGAFEPVIPLLDAINTIDSNRLDGIEQFIQSLILLINCELPEGATAKTLFESGIVQIKDNGDGAKQDIKILAEQLDQQQTQTLKDDLYNSVLTICAMPNRNGGSSTSDTGVAVIYRDGWNAAEASAAAFELSFKESEIEMLKLVLYICSELSSLAMNPSKIDIKFTRRNYENIETKSQVLNTMLGNPMIDPKLAFEYCNLFCDPEEAYQLSMSYYEKHKNDKVNEE